MVRCALKGMLTQGQTMYAKEFMFILFYGGEEYVEATYGRGENDCIIRQSGFLLPLLSSVAI